MGNQILFVTMKTLILLIAAFKVRGQSYPQPNQSSGFQNGGVPSHYPNQGFNGQSGGGFGGVPNHYQNQGYPNHYGSATHTYQGQDANIMNFLAKPALSLLTHEACPEAPFTCHGYIADGTCHGVCGQAHPGMTNGEAIIMSATHAYSYKCRKQCKLDIESSSCHSCIVTAMGVTTQSSRQKRSWFHSLTSSISSAVQKASSHIGAVVQGVTCTVKIAPTIAECVSSFDGNLENLMNCAGAASGSKDCICKVVCSVYPKGCNFCNNFGNFGKK